MPGTPIRDAVVLITGAASGIGRLMALDAASRGAKAVVIWDRDAAGAEAVAAECVAHGADADAVAVDLTDADAIARAATETLEKVSRVDILINCAGIVNGKDFLDLTDEEIERTFQVNALALFRTTRAFLPGMLERNKGAAVTIASAAGLIGVARQTDYSSSKFAAVGFTESLRAELAHRKSKVRTLLMCPYYINTGMFDGVKTRVPALLPILDQDEVAKKTLDALEQGKQRVVMPPFAHSVLFLKGLPTSIFDAVANIFGINASMDHFRGRREEP